MHECVITQIVIICISAVIIQNVRAEVVWISGMMQCTNVDEIMWYGCQFTQCFSETKEDFVVRINKLNSM